MDVHLPSLAPFPDAEKTAYLRVVAALAAADGELAREELLFLQAFCEDSELTHRDTARVLALARGADGYDLAADLRILRPSPLASTLLADLRVLAAADDVVTPAEEALIEQVSAALGREVPAPEDPAPVRNFLGDALASNSQRIIEVRKRMEAPDVTPAEIEELGRQLTALTRNQQRITGAAMDRAHAQAQRRLDGALPGTRAPRRPSLTTSTLLATLLGADDPRAGAAQVAAARADDLSKATAAAEEPVSLVWRLLGRFGRSGASAATT